MEYGPPRLSGHWIAQSVSRTLDTGFSKKLSKLKVNELKLDRYALIPFQAPTYRTERQADCQKNCYLALIVNSVSSL